MHLNENKFATALAKAGNLTINQLAEKSHLSRQTISLAKSGKGVRLETAARIAVALNCSIEELFDNK